MPWLALSCPCCGLGFRRNLPPGAANYSRECFPCRRECGPDGPCTVNPPA